MDDGGRLGLGTSTPVVDVHIKSGNTPTLRLEQDGSSGFTPQTWDVAGNEANFFIRDATSGSTLPFRIFPGAPSNALNIEGSTGDIGIGTTSPGGALHVLGSSADAEVKVLIDNQDVSAEQWSLTVLNTTAGGDFRISKQGTGGPEFEIGSDGTVNIGPGSGTVFSISPTGDVTVTGVGLVHDVPDYVFEDDFELMPLAALREFVRKEKHLPNVPSAKEIEANGLSLTNLQLRLLEKIEELALYTLAQDETIIELKARLAVLERQATP